ncbi:EF-hand domain-containing protein [Streptomyces sp. NPDC046203]|uniref:EF-hand domain-containing protein n=1 Tax=Streptomyces sp. NPDC046203 TaxID=3154602 RepID=UPI003404F0EC
MSTAVANDRLVKRFEKWDTDGNGVLEAGDFQAEAARIAKNLGKQADSPEAQELVNAFQVLFEGLAERVGVSATGGISQDQFLATTKEMLFEEGEASFNRALGPVVNALVNVCDEDKDGHISPVEFSSWLTAVGVPDAEAGPLFAQVDANGDGRLSEDELLRVMREFHFGTLDVELLG